MKTCLPARSNPGLVIAGIALQIFDIVNGFLIDAVAHQVRTPDLFAYTTDVESG